MEALACVRNRYINDRGFLDNRQEPHLSTTVQADEWVHFVNLLDQPCPSTTGVFDVLRIWIVRVRVK